MGSPEGHLLPPLSPFRRSPASPSLPEPPPFFASLCPPVRVALVGGGWPWALGTVDTTSPWAPQPRLSYITATSTQGLIFILNIWVMGHRCFPLLRGNYGLPEREVWVLPSISSKEWSLWPQAVALAATRALCRGFCCPSDGVWCQLPLPISWATSSGPPEIKGTLKGQLCNIF